MEIIITEPTFNKELKGNAIRLSGTGPAIDTERIELNALYLVSTVGTDWMDLVDLQGDITTIFQSDFYDTDLSVQILDASKEEQQNHTRAMENQLNDALVKIKDLKMQLSNAKYELNKK